MLSKLLHRGLDPLVEGDGLLRLMVDAYEIERTWKLAEQGRASVG
ncbi:MAG: hypothetical protein RLZZ450_1277 [Pseudomonadota bacterium]